MATLYLVATPIGNLEDISQRAIRILNEVILIAAEDTRRTKHLLAAHSINTPLTSYHEHNKKMKMPQLVTKLQREDIALVSDAGMPGINDPGYELVCTALENGISVVAIPGPSVLPVALAVSGLPASQFVYIGFLPRKKGERRRLLASINTEQRTILALEAPHRVLASLKDIEEILGDRRIAICRELTKVHEEIFRGNVSQAVAHFPQPRGEFTFVIEGYGEGGVGTEITNYVREELRRLRQEGVPAKEAVASVANAAKLPKNSVYKAWLELV